MKPTAVIFDIDGTLANLDHRLPLLQRKIKDFKAFENLVSKDSPIDFMDDIFEFVASKRKYQLILLTGRSEDCRENTVKWLKSITGWFDPDFDLLYMRNSREGPKKDFRPSVEFKREIIVNKILPKFDVSMIFDDDIRNIKMYCELGLPSCQVRATASRMRG